MLYNVREKSVYNNKNKTFTQETAGIPAHFIQSGQRTS